MSDLSGQPPALPPVTLHVCLTCRRADEPADAEPRAGARLFEAVRMALPADAPLRLNGVECLSNCKRACTAALTGQGRWSYVYGDLNPEADVADILDGALRYAATPDGLVEWRQRPQIFRKGVIARLPFTPV